MPVVAKAIFHAEDAISTRALCNAPLRGCSSSCSDVHDACDRAQGLGRESFSGRTNVLTSCRITSRFAT